MVFEDGTTTTVDLQSDGPIPSNQPILLTTEGSARAIALDSATLIHGPFPVVNEQNFSVDRRTRVSLFAINAGLFPGETISVFAATIENAQHAIAPATVEYVGPVSGHPWLSQIVLKLPDQAINAGDVMVSINMRGVASNKVIISIKPSE